jgi:hypothetical protein
MNMNKRLALLVNEFNVKIPSTIYSRCKNSYIKRHARKVFDNRKLKSTSKPNIGLINSVASSLAPSLSLARPSPTPLYLAVYTYVCI